MAAEGNITVQFDGDERLRKLLNGLENGTVINDGLKVAAQRLRLLSQGRSPVYVPQKGEHTAHPPGLLKKSWTQPTNERSMLWTFQAGTDYAGTLEEGAYPEHMVVAVRADGSPGRLVKEGGRVYSKRAPGGLVSPILQDTGRVNRIVNLVAREIKTQLERLAG